MVEELGSNRQYLFIHQYGIQVYIQRWICHLKIVAKL